MKVKTKVAIDGTEREIEVDLPDDQYLTMESHKARLMTEVKRRLSRHAAELSNDEEFVAGILRAKGVDPKNPKGGGGKGGEPDAETIERLQGEWRKRELDPMKQQLEQATTALNRTRHAQLVSELESALLAGDGAQRVTKGVARKLAELEASRGAFAYDEEHGYWAVKEGDGFAYASSVTKERPYKGAADFAADFVKNKDNAPFVERASQQGPGMQAGGNGGGGNPGNVRSRADFRSDAEKVKWIAENGHAAFAALPDK